MNIIIYQVLRGLYWLLQIASWAIVLRAILSWFLRPDMPVYSFLLRITEPMIAPFRPLAYKASLKLGISDSVVEVYLEGTIRLKEAELPRLMGLCIPETWNLRFHS